MFNTNFFYLQMIFPIDLYYYLISTLEDIVIKCLCLEVMDIILSFTSNIDNVHCTLQI